VTDEHVLKIDECQRQMLILALAKLSIERPGWNYALAKIAVKIDNIRPDGGCEMYEKFKSMDNEEKQWAVDGLIEAVQTKRAVLTEPYAAANARCQLMR
jgi:hypothetical protein